MSSTRREFLRDAVTAGAAVAGTAALPGSLMARGAPRGSIVGLPDPADPAGLAARAVEAARAAGASYADTRLTLTWNRSFYGNGMEATSVQDGAERAVGVRALVDGCWGFAASPYWTPEEMARLGREAVAQARTTAVGQRRRVDLAPVPAVRDGRWVMPVRTDPFTVPIEEVRDTLGSLHLIVSRTPGAALYMEWHFRRQEKTFASSEGSTYGQVTYRAEGRFVVSYRRGQQTGSAAVDFLGAAGRGWEHLRDNQVRLRESVPELIAEIVEGWTMPVKPVEVGRYDVVFDARSMSALLAQTLGPATELDRALGYEANAGGTSYLNDPLAMLGSYEAGSPLLTVTADRSVDGGLATVRWDDEGMAPDDFPLVEDGVLVDFQTTRESATWLADWYARRGRPVRSHGCASAPSAVDATLQNTPNLALAPGKDAATFEDLVAGTKKGVAVRGLGPQMDFQHLNGLGLGSMYEIQDGKRVALLGGAGLLFRAPELWKGVYALGGAEARRWYPARGMKGEPAQVREYSVGAPPAAVKQLTVIEVGRKA